jgi:phage protein D
MILASHQNPLAGAKEAAMSNNEKLSSQNADRGVTDARAVSDLSDDEVEEMFQELVARIDSEQHPLEADSSGDI